MWYAGAHTALPTLPRSLCGRSVPVRGHLGIRRRVKVSPTRYVINQADACTRGTADPWLTVSCALHHTCSDSHMCENTEVKAAPDGRRRHDEARLPASARCCEMGGSCGGEKQFSAVGEISDSLIFKTAAVFQGFFEDSADTREAGRSPERSSVHHGESSESLLTQVLTALLKSHRTACS